MKSLYDRFPLSNFLDHATGREKEIPWEGQTLNRINGVQRIIRPKGRRKNQPKDPYPWWNTYHGGLIELPPPLRLVEGIKTVACSDPNAKTLTGEKDQKPQQ